MDRELLLIGILVVVMGLVSLVYGNRQIPVKGGLILRVLSHAQPKWINVTIGVALIFAGGMAILKAAALI